MFKAALVGSFCVALSATGALAAPPAPVDTSLVNSPIYFQLLGGGVLGTGVTYSDPVSGAVLTPDTTLAGYAFAGTVGVVVMSGVSIEADVLRTHRVENGGTSDYTTTSFMGNVKGTVDVNDMFSLYGAAGVGFVLDEIHDAPITNTGSGLGFQLIAGASANITKNIAIVAEGRYQDTFSGVHIQPADVNTHIPTITLLAGVKVGF